jgi:hypothetical protein
MIESIKENASKKMAFSVFCKNSVNLINKDYWYVHIIKKC